MIEAQNVYIDLYKDKLVVDYTDGSETMKPLVMDISNTNDYEILSRLMYDPNFWMQFLQSLSQALANNRG